MNKIVTLLALSSLVLVADNLKELNQQEVEKLKTLSPVLSNPGLRIEKAYDRVDQNVYQIKAVGNSARGPMPVNLFVEKTSNVVFISPMAYDKSGNPIIDVPVSAADKEVILNGVSFTFGKGTKEIILMTDPECPYCKQFEQNMGLKIDNEYKVKVVLFPLSFHPKAIPLTQYILRGKTDEDKHARLKAVMVGNENVMRELIPKWDASAEYNKNADFMKELKEYQDVFNGSDKNWKKYFSTEKELTDLRDYLKKSNDSFRASGAKGTPNIFSGDSLKEINPASL